MPNGFRIGRLFGIDIHIDWSWLFIFLLVTGNLAMGVFPVWHPQWTVAMNWLVASAASLLFFASVLAHELSHSLVARARGLPVRRITLFLFGGVSNIEREPQSAGTELVMALVGPVTSILLGLVFLFLGTLAGGTPEGLSDPVRALSRLDPISTLLLWLGPTNIVVGVFNLIPGFPLDGGRVLRAIVWAATGNLRTATHWASRIGQLIGWALIIAGLAMVFGARVPVFGTGLVGGLWLAFIGWFLSSAAQSQYQMVLIRDLLSDVPVSRLMRPGVINLPEETTVEELVYDYIMKTDDRAFTVADENGIVGLVSLEDVKKVRRDDWSETRVTQIMTPANQVVFASLNENAGEALDQLTSCDVRQLPVLNEGRLVGMLRRRDILKWLQLHSGLAAG